MKTLVWLGPCIGFGSSAIVCAWLFMPWLGALAVTSALIVSSICMAIELAFRKSLRSSPTRVELAHASARRRVSSALQDARSREHGRHIQSSMIEMGAYDE